MSIVAEFELTLALQELIRIDSQTNSIAEQQALGWVDQILDKGGIDHIKIPNGKGQYAAVIAKVEKRRSKTAVISNGHLDVVNVGSGWTREQGEIEGSRVYGRGASDMKIGVIAQITALQMAASDRTSGFDHWALIVCGEETTGLGTEQAVDFCRPGWERYPHLAAIIPEPTSSIDRSSGTTVTKVMYGNMGCFSAEIVIGGDTGHAATSRGKANSIELGADIIQALRPLRSEWGERYVDAGLGVPVLTPTMIKAGIAPNSLPPENILRLDGRFPIELKGKYETDLRQALKDFPQAALRILYYANPAFTSPTHLWVRANLQAFGQDRAELPLWTTDGCFFSEYRDKIHEGIPLVIAGPGFLDQLHVPNESCDTRLIPLWAQRFLAASSSFAQGIIESGA